MRMGCASAVAAIASSVTLADALVACAHSAPSKAYAGAPANPLESARAFVHRAVTRAREHMETIQLACLRDKESKLESLRAEDLTPAEVDARALRLQSEAERCISGD